MRVAVLFTGRGSNFKSILDFSKNSNYEVICSITDNQYAQGVKISVEAGVPCLVLPLRGLYKNRIDDWEAIITDFLEKYDIDLVVLAGFMIVLHSKFCERWRGKCINIHPSLLPKYPGLHTHARALEAEEPFHGCSIHYVTSEVDGGPLIAQAILEVNPNLHSDELAAEILVLENRLYPRVVEAISDKRIVYVRGTLSDSVLYDVTGQGDAQRVMVTVDANTNFVEIGNHLTFNSTLET